MKSEDRNKFYLEKMKEEYKNFCSSYCRFMSYKYKIIDSKNITEDELELLQNLDEKFIKKMEHLNKLLNANKDI